MLKNTCSAFITTNNAHRALKWQRLFGSDRLPVKQEKPRHQWLPLSVQMVLAYDLDAKRLHPMQRVRFADYISKRTGMTHSEAMTHVDGWPLDADGCSVVTADLEPVLAVGQRPSFLYPNMVYSFS